MFLFNKTDLKCICTVFYPPVGPLTQVPYDQTFPVYLSSNPNSNPVVLKHLAVRGLSPPEANRNRSLQKANNTMRPPKQKKKKILQSGYIWKISINILSRTGDKGQPWWSKTPTGNGSVINGNMDQALRVQGYI